MPQAELGPGVAQPERLVQQVAELHEEARKQDGVGQLPAKARPQQQTPELMGRDLQPEPELALI